jgi:putative nucleotidyltransferase with HDIG domain
MTTIKQEKIKDWRKAVRKAMHAAALKEVKQRHGVVKASFNYRWEHVTAVVAVARKLAELIGADVEIVEAAAWLHDILKETGVSHPAEGAAFAREFLPQTNFPPEKIEAVATAIADHIRLRRDEPLTNLESMALWDADKLTKMGLTAAFHNTGLTLAAHKTMRMTDLIRRGRNNGWQRKTINSLHTEPARQAAKKRIRAFNKLWDNLEKELNGDDLA